MNQMRLVLFAVLLLTTTGAYRAQDEPSPSSEALSRAPDVKIEELTTHPEKYDNSLVRVKVVWVDGYHGSLLCPLDDAKHCIGTYLECREDEGCKSIRAMLDKNLNGEVWNKRGKFVLVGRFKDKKIPPGMSSPRFFLAVLKIAGVLPKPSK
jgi:hypothetical protein